MPHCPDCGESVDSVTDLQTDFDGTGYDDNPNRGDVMYACPACGAILGVGRWRSEYSY
jgi:predicted RNA-binding Zn-ribbon protein involved in translation (DUF1610 family)